VARVMEVGCGAPPQAIMYPWGTLFHQTRGPWSSWGSTLAGPDCSLTRSGGGCWCNPHRCPLQPPSPSVLVVAMEQENQGAGLDTWFPSPNHKCSENVRL
jgi:hypothetical protein